MQRRITALDGITALLILLLIVQVWLLSATLDAFLAGHGDAALPGAIASGVIFIAAVWLYRFARRIDRAG
jgi:hypothetical protein